MKTDFRRGPLHRYGEMPTHFENFSKRFLGCDPSRHLQESPGPPGPKSQKNLKKGLFGGLEKSLKKISEKV